MEVTTHSMLAYGAACTAVPPPPLKVFALQLALVNRQYLHLLAVDGGLPDALALRVRGLSDSALTALGDCQFSLFTLAFDDSRRWLEVIEGLAAHPELPDSDSPHSVRCEFASTVVFFAWHLAHSEPLAGKVLLELDARVADALRGVSVAQLRALACKAADFLAPRWPENGFCWSSLIHNATDPAGNALQAAKLLGWQLLALRSLGMVRTGTIGTERSKSVPARWRSGARLYTDLVAAL